MKLIKVEGKKDILKISNGFFFENTKEVREGCYLAAISRGGIP